MADFDDHFADPFADPAISNALNQQTYVSLGTSDGLGHTSTAASAAAGATGLTGDASELKSREAELARREAELARREAGLREQEQNLRRHGLNPPNWPPLYPLIYHSIEDEIPIDSRKIMQRIYYYWLGSVAVLLLNFVACLVLLLTATSPAAPNDFGSSLIYMFTFTPLSFFLWYRPVYTAFAKESSLFFYIFLLFAGFHVAFCAYMAVGFSGSGSAGLINALAALSHGFYGTAAICFLVLAGWVAGVTVGVILWTSVQLHTKRGGHSLNSARTQAVQMGVLGGMSAA